MLTNRACFVPVSIVLAAPYNLPWTSSIFATVSATNAYGTSADSAPGDGAVIVTVPNPPTNLANNSTLTTAYQIGFTWSPATFNGGTPLISYKINYDQGIGVWMMLQQNVLVTNYLLTGLTAGRTY